ncbi:MULTISPECIES: hypothetical protein [Paraburkholderia]|nr:MULTISPECIES: hypothetical protein [Paraburkholderia]MCX4174664.1 hypothetical protein [Paraburkholderia madseniana]MDQ6462665.1 hypothetical protein [Paraburkholderia madseniana]
MSIVMPVIVVLETTLILWLLVVLARRQGGRHRLPVLNRQVVLRTQSAFC